MTKYLKGIPVHFGSDLLPREQQADFNRHKSSTEPQTEQLFLNLLQTNYHLEKKINETQGSGVEGSGWE